MDPHPDQYRDLMKQQLEEQRVSVARNRKTPTGTSERSRILRPLSRYLARVFLRLAFALDSTTAWDGLRDSLSSSDTASRAERRPG